MVWLPVAFICFFGADCGFASGRPTATASQCEQKNYKLRHELVTDMSISRFELVCLQIPKEDFI
tara:strand:- start:174 stop:365 length:192 start_codon:yes stop_codon:yes gene_type:complete